MHQRMFIKITEQSMCAEGYHTENAMLDIHKIHSHMTMEGIKK